MADDHGLRILKDTGCRVGTHLWVWTAANSTETMPLIPPDPEHAVCLCGRHRWTEVKTPEMYLMG